MNDKKIKKPHKKALTKSHVNLQRNALDFKRVCDNDEDIRATPQKGMYAGITDRENFVEFYTIMKSNKRTGRPWTYPSAQALQDEITKYVIFSIDRKMPLTVASMCAWLGVTTVTLRSWKQNKGTMPFYEVVEGALAFIQAMIEQGAVDGNIPPMIYTFMSKNYHGLKDKIDYTIAPNNDMTKAEQTDIINELPNITIEENNNPKKDDD